MKCLPFAKGYFGLPDWKISKISGMSSEVNVIKDYQPDYLNGKVSSICDFLPIPDPVLKVKLVPDSLCKLERVA